MMKKDYNVKEIIKSIEDQDDTLKIWRKHYEMEQAIIEKLIKTRKNQLMSQNDLANKTGLKQSAIARIEKGVNSPQLSTIIELVDALDLEIKLIPQIHFRMDFNEVFEFDKIHGEGDNQFHESYQSNNQSKSYNFA